MVPDYQACRQLMAEHRMLANIKAHSILVARIAELLVENLQKSGLALGLELTVSAALLHDIGKTSCLNTRADHARKGKEICLRHGYHEIAGIVEEHVILKPSPPGQSLSATEIVYYADKRVNHDRIVSLAERLDYILERYGQNSESRCRAIKENFRKCCEIEREIFSYLTFAPAELAVKIQAHHGTIYDFFVADQDLK
jgi:putative nucleotidyltransferase with HDIG domain